MKITREEENIFVEALGMFDANEFTDYVDKHLESHEKVSIVVNWRDTGYLCSEDISALVVANRKVARRGGKVYFYNVCGELFSQLECFNLHHLFVIGDSEAEVRRELGGFS